MYDRHLTEDEIVSILRIHPPLIMNRRATTRNVEFDGFSIKAGERIAALWASVNRDEAVLGIRMNSALTAIPI